MKPQLPPQTRRDYEVPQIELRPVTIEPEELGLYPDYMIGELTKRGIGRIEADRSLEHDGKVDFVFTQEGCQESEVIGSLGVGMFRPALARFGPRVRCDDMLYGGHTLFRCNFEREGETRTAFFSLFVCNLQHCGFWLRLYLYQFDDNSRPRFEPRR